MPELWRRISTEQILDCKVFRVKENVSVSPVTKKEHKFYVLEAKDWMNIIAITPERKVVLVRQFRHGIGEITLEIPAGGIEKKDQSVEGGIQRELLEETGYSAKELVYLGAVHSNPAILNNKCHTFLAINAEKIASQNLDGTEDIKVEEFDLDQISSMIVSGMVNHSLTVAAFYLFEQYQKKEINK